MGTKTPTYRVAQDAAQADARGVVIAQGGEPVGAANPLQVTGIASGGDATAANQATMIADLDAIRVASQDTTPVNIVGNTASGAALADAPVAVGGRGSTTNPTPVADGQAVLLRLTKSGNLVVVPHQVRELIGATVSPIALAITTGSKIVSSVGNGIFLDLTFIKFTNTTAAPIHVNIYDDQAVSVIRDSFTIPANDTRGIVFPSPFQQSTANKEWWAIPAATGVECVAQWAQRT